MPSLTNVISSSASNLGDVNINNSNLSVVDIKSLSVEPSSLFINNFIISNTSILVNNGKGQFFYGNSNGENSLVKGEMSNSELIDAKISNYFGFILSDNLKLNDSTISNSTVSVLGNSISGSYIVDNSNIHASSVNLLNAVNSDLSHLGVLSGSYFNQFCRDTIEDGSRIWICEGR